MARYIDADKLIEGLELSIKSWSADCNSNAPAMVTAYKDVLHRVKNLPAANVVPKSEVEIRGGSFYFELAKVEERGKQLMREHDSKIAREIFEEVEKSVHSKIPKQIHPIFKNDRDFGDGFRDGKTDALIEVLVLISELKKKYTEGK